MTVLAILGLALALVVGLNRGALAPQTVGMDVADGCATVFVRDLYEAANPVDGYRKVNAEDVYCGRFRPLGHYYMAASYALNALRCGVPFVLGCQRPMADLANAELSGHTRYQLVFAGLVAGLGAWLVLSQTGSWAAAAAALLLAASALSLAGNLYKYYADGQEILLALMALAYLFLFLKGLDAIEEGLPCGGSLAGGFACAVLMTASKETAIVVAAMVLGFCGTMLAYRWWRRGCRLAFGARDRYLAAHAVFLALTQVWLLVNIPPATGRYTAQYSLRGGPDLRTRLATLLGLVDDNPGAGSYLLAVVLLCALAGLLIWVRPAALDRRSRRAFRLALLSGGAGVGSILVYLPWQLVARKYLYCAEIFLVVCTASLIGALLAVGRAAGVRRLVLAAAGLGLVVVPLANLHAAAVRNARFYADFYEGRRFLAAACRILQTELLRRPPGGAPARVAVFEGLVPLGHDDIHGQEQLHMERFLNQCCGLNVLSRGRLESVGRSDYSSRVLAPRPYAPMVEVSLLPQWQEGDWTDVLLIDADNDSPIDFAGVRRRVEDGGRYELAARWQSSPGVHGKRVGDVALYRRRATMAGTP